MASGECQSLVDKIESAANAALAKFSGDPNAPAMPFQTHFLIHASGYSLFVSGLIKSFGKKQIAEFFPKENNPNAKPGHMSWEYGLGPTLFDLLWDWLFSCIVVDEHRKLFFDVYTFSTLTENLFECIRKRRVPYVICTRFLYLETFGEISLSQKFSLEPSTGKDIISTLVPESFPGRINSFRDRKEYEGIHSTFLTYTDAGTNACDYPTVRGEGLQKFNGSLIDALHFSGFHIQYMPKAAETCVFFPFGRSSIPHFEKPSLREPMRIADEATVSSLVDSFNLLTRCERDRVLLTSVDRFMKGIQSLTSSHRNVSEPNWDRIVDYVIALESIFLSGSGMQSELSYRFRLNGTAILSRSLQYNRDSLFVSLKHLYNVRSTIVHGGDGVIKEARKFVSSINPDFSEKEAYNVFAETSRISEDFLRVAIQTVESMSLKDRPYALDLGWEKLVWSTPAP